MSKTTASVSLLILAMAPAAGIAAVCDVAVQGRIAWNDQGNTRWNPENIGRLCAGAEDSVEPARCFERVMHGGVPTGTGARIGWQEVLSLCAGTRDHAATVACFTGRLGSGSSRGEAIADCRRRAAAKAMPRAGSGIPPPTLPLRNLPMSAVIPAVARAPTIRHRINVVEHLCVNTPCEYGDRGWDKTRTEMDHDGTETTTFEVDVAGARLVRLCPVRRRTTDREFGGNGPAIRAFSAIEQAGNLLRLSAFMEAKETGRGSSIAFKTWRGDLYRAPAGWRITGFEPQRSETAYTDRNHEEDRPPVRGGALVAEFRFKGDTGGDDIGNCTTDDTYMTIAYNPVVVNLEAERSDLRPIRINRGVWQLGLGEAIKRLVIRINNYDRTRRQPENGIAENRYYVNRTDPATWSRLSEEQIRAGSYFEYRSSPANPVRVPPTPLPVPDIRRGTFTFLLNDIVSSGRTNAADPAGDHIRFTIRFESSEPEVVAACVDNVACGTGEPHEAGKPLVQVDNLKIYPYLRPRVDRTGGPLIRAELTRVRMDADIRRDGVCRDNVFAFACGAFAGNIERIVYEAILDQLNAFVAGSAALTGLLDQQLTNGICSIVSGMGERCENLDNIVLDENGDLLLWMRG